MYVLSTQTYTHTHTHIYIIFDSRYGTSFENEMKQTDGNEN